MPEIIIFKPMKIWIALVELETLHSLNKLILNIDMTAIIRATSRQQITYNRNGSVNLEAKGSSASSAISAISLFRTVCSISWR